MLPLLDCCRRDLVFQFRKFKADRGVMSRADLLCGKLKSIAASDKTTISALTKQLKTERPKAKKDESTKEVQKAAGNEPASNTEDALKISTQDSKVTHGNLYH